MRVWLAGWGAKWLCPSVDAVDNVINAIIPYGFEGLPENAPRYAKFPQCSMNLIDLGQDQAGLFRSRTVIPAKAGTSGNPAETSCPEAPASAGVTVSRPAPP